MSGLKDDQFSDIKERRDYRTMHPNKPLFNDIRIIIQQARQKAYASVNFVMVEAYWQIGKRIVQDEQEGEARAEYGKKVIRELSKQLSAEFGRGFTEANIWNFRQFYLIFQSEEKLYALRRELTWTHYRLIMRQDNPSARDYYMEEAAEQNWSTRVLERQINSLYYERLLTSRNKAPVIKEMQEKTASLAQTPQDLLVLTSGYENGFENFYEPTIIKVKHEPENPYYDGEFQIAEVGL